jgi:hypothetical protein
VTAHEIGHGRESCEGEGDRLEFTCEQIVRLLEALEPLWPSPLNGPTLATPATQRPPA